MPPKKKSKAAPVEEKADIQVPDQCEVDTVNMDHYNALEKAIQTILQHELFEKIMTEEPLGIKAGVESHLAGHKAGRGVKPFPCKFSYSYIPCVFP